MFSLCVVAARNVSLAFQGSAFVEGSKRTVIGPALAVGFFLSGHGFANFDRTLRQYLGISCISKNRYYDVIKTGITT